MLFGALAVLLYALFAAAAFHLRSPFGNPVKDGDGELLAAPRSRADVPESLRLDVISSAKECPGECIHVVRDTDDVEVAGPDAS